MQLIVDAIRLSTHISFFAIHVKLFNLLVQLEAKYRVMIPCAQYLMYPFDQVNYVFFSAKDLKSIP